MTKDLQMVIKTLTSAFRRKFDDYKGMYVFGESKDGKIHDDEDIEIVALFETQDKAKREEIWPIVGKVETSLEVCIDLYPYTQDEFEKDEDIYDEVMEEGIFFNSLGIKDNS